MYKKIIIPIDLEDKVGSKLLVQEALEQSTEQTEVILISVVAGFSYPVVAAFFPKDAMEKALLHVETELQPLKALLEKKVSKVDCLAKEGVVHQEVVKIAQKEMGDLIIIRAQQHDAVEKMMLGSVSAKVLQHAPCSVLVVK